MLEQEKRNYNLLASLLMLLGLVSACQGPRTYRVDSPDKKLSLAVGQDTTGGWTYKLVFDGTEVLGVSRLGFNLAEGRNVLAAGWSVEKVTRRKVDDIWKPLWGKRETVIDRYHELQMLLADDKNRGNKLLLSVRAYDDGVAFRYEVPEDATLNGEVLSERTSYNFAGNYTAWFYNGENHNIGPESLMASEGTRKPVMTVKATPSLYMAIHEACLDEGEPLRLDARKGETEFTVASKPRSLHPGYRSAWRTILCGTTPGTLVDSHLLELLNPESEGDFSWVKPGMALWDWRINGARWKDFTYSMSYPSWVKMVDFAAEQGFRYLVLDANWYGPEFHENSDPTKGDKARDVQRLIAYGKQKGVGIWLYLNDVGGRAYPLEETLAQYGRWGAAGVKYGFMKGTMEEKNLRTRMITELCAKNRLLVDYHDNPVHPYGQSRTWPNAVTREYCHAQLDGYHVFVPATFVTSVFVNMLAGPLDMNNGMFELHQGKTTRVDNNQEVPSTLTSEAARTLITYSGVTILPDIPEYYKKYPSLLRFLSAQKMPWKESRTLSGEIGEYIVMMRRATDGTYLVGAATNEEERVVEVPLTFLDKGEFQVEISEDGRDAHYQTQRESMHTYTRMVTRDDTLCLRLAPGGGACLLLTPLQ